MRKDLDWSTMGRRIGIAEELVPKLQMQLGADAAFLSAQSVIDYSLLVVTRAIISGVWVAFFQRMPAIIVRTGGCAAAGAGRRGPGAMGGGAPTGA